MRNRFATRRKVKWAVVLVLAISGIATTTFYSTKQKRLDASLLCALHENRGTDAHRLLESGADPKTIGLPPAPKWLMSKLNVWERIQVSLKGGRGYEVGLGMPAIAFAVTKCPSEIDDLVQHGADVNAPDFRGCPPIFY